VKAQCEKCKEIVALDFRVTDGGIEVTCGGCAERYFVAQREVEAAPTADAPPADASGDGLKRCPKCAEPSGERDSCRRCGLVFARWNPEAAALPDVAESAELWARVEAAWDRDEAHDAFIEHCRKAGALAVAASRYRSRGAEARLAQIRSLAEQTLAATPKSQPPPPSRRAQWLVAGVLAVVLGALILKIVTS
jgi:hypothetical protein